MCSPLGVCLNSWYKPLALASLQTEKSEFLPHLSHFSIICTHLTHTQTPINMHTDISKKEQEREEENVPRNNVKNTLESPYH